MFVIRLYNIDSSVALAHRGRTRRRAAGAPARTAGQAAAGTGVGVACGGQASAQRPKCKAKVIQGPSIVAVILYMYSLLSHHNL